MLKITTNPSCNATWRISSAFKTLNYSEICKDPICISAMRMIDNAEIVLDRVIKTPFGITTIDNLSNGCKTLILSYVRCKNGGKPVDVVSAGDNVIDAMLVLSKKYDVDFYIDTERILYPGHVSGDFELNGKIYKDKSLYIELMNTLPGGWGDYDE